MLEQVVNGVASSPLPTDEPHSSSTLSLGQTPPLGGVDKRRSPLGVSTRPKGSARSVTDNLLRQSLAALGEALSAASLDAANASPLPLEPMPTGGQDLSLIHI